VRAIVPGEFERKWGSSELVLDVSTQFMLKYWPSGYWSNGSHSLSHLSNEQQLLSSHIVCRRAFYEALGFLESRIHYRTRGGSAIEFIEVNSICNEKGLLMLVSLDL
jgi:hypothetical protein